MAGVTPDERLAALEKQVEMLRETCALMLSTIALIGVGYGPAIKRMDAKAQALVEKYS